MKRILTLAALLALAGCSAPAATTPSPTPTIRETYAQVTELRDAAIAAGYPCPSWRETNRVTLAASSGTCSDKDVFSVYLTSDAAQQVVTQLKRVSGSLGVSLLVGKNWIINAPAESLPGLQAKLGGQVVKS